MVENWIDKFLSYLKFEKRYSLLTIEAYRTDLSQFLAFLQLIYPELAIDELGHFHIRTWLSGMRDLDTKPKTLNRKKATLTSFFKYLQKNGVVKKNPAMLLHSQKLPERLPVSLEKEETQRLFEQPCFPEDFTGLTDKLICEILYQTGLRRQELIQLKNEHISRSLLQLHIIGKGNKPRIVPIAQELLTLIDEYNNAKQQLEATPTTNTLLVLPDGKPLYPMYVYRTVKKYMALVTTRTKKSPHVFRHTFATQMMDSGANIQAIKNLLGHSSLASTQIYTHNSLSKLKEIHKRSHPKG
ncbi:MAG: integrase [Chitinophagia bacterium]|nr:integrase [Chitinophagia bacterium]